MKQMRQLTLRTIPALLLATFSGATLAAGFALQNQTGSGNGNAFAGAAAAAEDAGTIFFNPAGMSLLPQGGNLSLAATHLNRKIEFSDSGTTPATLNAVTPTNGGDAGGGSIIPAAYYAHGIGSGLTVGIGVSPTFGNKTEYTTDFYGRFSGYFADLKIINLNPSVAYKVNETLSVGGGINYASATVEFKQKQAASTNDVILKGDDKALGYNFGVMYQPMDGTRIGAAYRSKLKYTLEGDLKIVTTAGVVALTTPISAELETPDSLSLALSQKLGDRLELLADLTWTGWSSVQTLSANKTGGNCPVPSQTTCASLSFNFKDTYRAGIGANYQYSDALKLKAGVAYDQSPVRSASDRTMTLPDSDRTWLSVGARYAFTKVSSIDVGYTHILFKDASTSRIVQNPATFATIQTVNGNFDTSVDILSLQYNHNF